LERKSDFIRRGIIKTIAEVSMSRRILIAFILGWILLAGCGGQKATDGEAYPAPTRIPAGSEAKLYPYPGDENNKPLIGNAGGSSAYPAPETMEPYPAPGGGESFVPQPADEEKIRGEAMVEEVNIREVADLDEYMLDIKGMLPTPCHELRIVSLPPDEESRIEVDVYSVLSADSVCTQVLEPYEATISLGIYTDGKYTVWINGEKVGDIQP